ncbi:hypothetical protein ESCAB7627_0330 [Escherichia albertii TW07627]|uniref:Uncharacterized protein n=1 Tax=Escherichia albertii (strain TW07627) TaxID=502347 RepID=A0ABC9NQB7_ESCAT|nr:hypothetical protein ESCAB7627_0330 [Escherichia albertii TW07627]
MVALQPGFYTKTGLNITITFTADSSAIAFERQPVRDEIFLLSLLP